MTLEEMKQKVYSLIEEYNDEAEDLTEDEDLALKMNSVINQIQNELIRYKKIPAIKQLEVAEGQTILLADIDKNIYQLEKVTGVDANIILNEVTFNEDGIAKIYYYKYPNHIDADTEDDYIFELSNDILEIMPYGVAADLLKSDVSSQYGEVYARRYKEMLSMLDGRLGTGIVYIDGGID